MFETKKKDKELQTNKSTKSRYETMFKMVVKEELSARGIDDVTEDELNKMFQSFMDKDYYTTIMNEELVNELMDELQYDRCPSIESMGTIMKDIYDLARSSENFTWFIEQEDVAKYSKKEWEEFLDNLETLDSLINDMESIVECPRNVNEILEYPADPAVTIYGSFLRLFDKKSYQDHLNQYEEEIDSGWDI